MQSVTSPFLPDEEPTAPSVPVQTSEPSTARRAEVRRVGRAAGVVRQRQADLDAASDLVDRIVQYVGRHRPDLAEAMKEVEPELRAEFGGGDHYVRARGADDRAAEGVARVLAAFNGRNVSEVARELGISRATVYRRLRQAGKR